MLTTNIFYLEAFMLMDYKLIDLIYFSYVNSYERDGVVRFLNKILFTCFIHIIV
jgi:hypothetical protein